MECKNTSNNELYSVISGLISVILICCIAVSIAYDIGNGKVAKAEKKLEIGKTFECLTEPISIDDEYYSLVRSGDRIFGLRFKETPPKKGIVAKPEKEVIFLLQSQ